MKKNLDEELYGLFYDIFKTSGNPLSVKQMDHLRDNCDKMARIIHNEARRYFLEILEEVNEKNPKEIEKKEKKISSDLQKP